VPDVSLSKVANCFVESATTTSGLLGPVKGAVDSYRKLHGGLWVGGRIHVRNGRIWFTANGVNRLAHSNVENPGLNLADVVSVEVDRAY
jgi:hypothetical protein